MDLFDYQLQETRGASAPLSERLRPRNLDELVGQKHLIGNGKLLRNLIEQDRVSSMILHGPPSSGKTSLASIISQMTKSRFVQLNAVSLTVGELRDVFKKALDDLKLYQQKTIVFIDEIHAMKSNVQEALLPVVENGTITLIGATTESIQHEIIPPLASRCRIYHLKPLSEDDIKQAIMNALKDTERGLGKLKVGIEPEALNYLANICNGDIRNALNALENAVYSLRDSNTVDLATIQQAFQYRINSITTHDMYDLTSAFCKSIRGGQTDAALYWMARLLDSGVDPLYIARRMVVHSSEDIGMANPHALQIALAAKEAVIFLGMPEARIPLAQAVIYLCESPKSNSAYKAIARAFDAVKNNRAYPVPDSIKDGSKTYINPIDHPNSKIQYMPEELKGVTFYEPQNSGVEAKIYHKYRS
jgi:putative ATPase